MISVDDFVTMMDSYKQPKPRSLLFCLLLQRHLSASWQQRQYRKEVAALIALFSMKGQDEQRADQRNLDNSVNTRQAE